jgi:hypothetical protein
MKWPCELLKELFRYWATGCSNTHAVTDQIRKEVRESVHNARNLAQVAISTSRNAERASAETTRVAEDAIRRLERGRGEAHGQH